VKIDEIVLRALQGKPELRYQTAGEFKTVVATMASPSPSSKTPPPPSPPPPAPPAPAPTRVPKPAPEPVPLAARMPETAPPARERDQRLALILLLAAFFGTPLLMSIVRPSSQDTVFLLGLCCAIASLVFAIRARRSRTGKTVLAVWATLIAGCAMLLFLYFVPAKKAARALSEANLRESQLKADQARDRALELEARGTAARNATGPGTRPEAQAQAQDKRAAAAPAGGIAGPGVTVHIGISADGVTSLDGRAVSPDELSGELRKLKDRKLTPYVEIEPDPALPYAKVMPVLELCRQAEVTNVTVLQPVLEEVPPLPAGSPDKPSEPLLPEAEPIRIRIAADESLTLDGESVSLYQLRKKLVAITRQGGKERPVVVSGRPTVRAKRIQEVMEACGNADLTRISLEEATEHLRQIDLNIALKSYEKLQTQLRDARLDRELLNASGTPTDDDLNKAEHLILTLQQQVDEARVTILKLQPETELQTK
jgi:biopolymer transport protein ExbD